MKKILTTAVAIILIATANYAQNVPNYVPTNGLVGWWPFNGNANDESGNGNNGTVNGATVTTDRNGIANKAYSFNGNQNGIIVNNNVFNVGSANISYSISLWLLSDLNSNTTGEVINNRVDAQSSNYNFRFSVSTNPTQQSYGLWSYVNPNLAMANSASNILVNQIWNHFVLVGDIAQNQMKIYRNGLLIASSNTIVSPNLTNPTKFGYMSNLDPSFKGKLDDIGIWNRVLTQQEVTALYNSCANTTATITPNGNTTFCQGGSLALQASAGNSYSWSNGATTQSITVTQGNTYTVTVTDGNGCTASASQVVTVNPIPAINFSLPSFISNTVNNFGLNATPSGGTFSGASVNGNIFDASQAGLGNKTIDYSVTVNNCSNTASANTIVYDTTGLVCTTRDTITTFISVTDTLLIDVTITGLTPPNNVNTVKVYPNPANNALFINNGNLTSMAGYSIKITNSLGQVFFNEPVNQQQFFVDISTWATGTYLLYVINPQQAVVETKQVVLQ
jgi:hypothetical protein